MITHTQHGELLARAKVLSCSSNSGPHTAAEGLVALCSVYFCDRNSGNVGFSPLFVSKRLQLGDTSIQPVVAGEEEQGLGLTQ